LADILARNSLFKGIGMNELMLLDGTEPRKILQTVTERKSPAVMSYLSKDKWHAARVALVSLGANKFDVEVMGPACEKTDDESDAPLEGKPHPLNIRIDQPVGISVKYGYGKFVFETTVVGFEPSQDPNSGGIVALAVPDRIEILQRRSYFRVEVPKSLKVRVTIWRRNCANDGGEVPPKHYLQGRLVDISAGGAQVCVDAAQKPDFKKGQFMGVRFTPMPYETPLMFNGQVRSVLPTSDKTGVCFGMQIVGLEASDEGREILRRLCNVVERYYQINQSSAERQVV
jgi:hypothetical protein